MASAAILSLEEFRDRRRCGEIRQRLHDRFDQWLDGREERVKASQPTLAELTQAVFALRQEVTQAVTEGLTVLDVAPSREEILAKLTAVATGQPWRPILALAIDGADVPTRPETAKGRRPGRKRDRAKRARRDRRVHS